MPSTSYGSIYGSLIISPLEEILDVVEIEIVVEAAHFHTHEAHLDARTEHRRSDDAAQFLSLLGQRALTLLAGELHRALQGRLGRACLVVQPLDDTQQDQGLGFVGRE